ncbi:hypothetical protein [Okeania sp. SIO2B3]|nr:hypothetical protein [Okeania sp. SIO2B3]NET43681.1 hypothetical protein [Okeania sp. SIO2B3]
MQGSEDLHLWQNPYLALTCLRVVWDLGNAEVVRILWNQAIATVKE